MNKFEVFWNSKPIGLIEDMKSDNSRIHGKWNPYRSLSHLQFIDSLNSDPEPRLFIGSENSELNGVLSCIKDEEIEIDLDQ